MSEGAGGSTLVSAKGVGVPAPIILTTQDLLKRLKTTEAELTALAPAPRVHLDREAVLSLVQLCHRAIEDLSRVH